MDEVRADLINNCLEKINKSFGKPRQCVADPRLIDWYASQNWGCMIAAIKSELKLDMRLRMGIVRSGGPASAPAWVTMPKNMPYYGSKAFLRESPFETIVMVMAHELSHIVLEATGNELRTREEAVDLTAMFLGFRKFYVLGVEWISTTTSIGVPTSFFADPLRYLREKFLGETERITLETRHRASYLLPREVLYAAALIEAMRK